MKIVIVGGGKIGEFLCRDLSSDANDIVIIEKNPEVLDYILSNNDIMGIVGNGASYPILMEAGMEDTDVFIAVTPTDELNIIAASMAKKLGASYTIARVRNPEYSQYMEFVRGSLGIDLMLNPEYEAAVGVSWNLKYPSAINVESFSRNRAYMIELLVKQNSVLNGLKLADIRSRFKKQVLICIVERGEEVYIPDGNFVLKAGDKIHVTGVSDALSEFYHIVGEKKNAIRSLFIIGGGRMTYYLLKILQNQSLKTKVIEINRDKARQLSEEFPDVIFINDDGTSRETLEEENFRSYDSMISLTGIDEENLIMSMYAEKVGIPKSMAKINRVELLDIVDPEGTFSVIVPKQIAADIITRVVRSLSQSRSSNMLTLFRLVDNRVEAAEFAVSKKSKIIDIPLKDLDTKQDTLIAYIARRNQIIFPGGNDCIKAGDHVMLISKTPLEDVDEILR